MTPQTSDTPVEEPRHEADDSSSNEGLESQAILLFGGVGSSNVGSEWWRRERDLQDSYKPSDTTSTYVAPNVYEHSRTPGRFSNQLVSYHVQTDTWSVIKAHGKAPSPRTQHSVCVVGDYYIVFVGLCDKGYLNDVHVLYLKTMTWHKPPVKKRGPSPRGHHSATPLSSTKMLVHGGENGDGAKPFRDTYVLDTATMTWAKVGQDSPDLTQHAAVCLAANPGMPGVATAVYFLGGLTGNQRGLSTVVYVLSLDDMTWGQVLVKSASPGSPPPRTGLVGASVCPVGTSGSQFLLWGGSRSASVNKPSFSNDLYIAKVSANGIVYLGEYPSGDQRRRPDPRGWATMVAFPSQEVYIIGGWGERSALEDTGPRPGAGAGDHSLSRDASGGSSKWNALSNEVRADRARLGRAGAAVKLAMSTAVEVPDVIHVGDTIQVVVRISSPGIGRISKTDVSETATEVAQKPGTAAQKKTIDVPWLVGKMRDSSGQVQPVAFRMPRKGQTGTSIAAFAEITMNKTGTVVLDITFQDGTRVEGSPFEIVVKPGAVSPDHSTVHGAALRGCLVNVPARATVTLRDRYSNPVPVTDQKLRSLKCLWVGTDGEALGSSHIQLAPPSSSSQGSTGGSDTSPTSVTLVCTFPSCGSWTAKIKYKGKLLKGMPQMVAVSSGPANADPLRSTLFGTPYPSVLHSLADSPAQSLNQIDLGAVYRADKTSEISAPILPDPSFVAAKVTASSGALVWRTPVVLSGVTKIRRAAPSPAPSSPVGTLRPSTAGALMRPVIASPGSSRAGAPHTAARQIPPLSLVQLHGRAILGQVSLPAGADFGNPSVRQLRKALRDSNRNGSTPVGLGGASAFLFVDVKTGEPVAMRDEKTTSMWRVIPRLHVDLKGVRLASYSQVLIRTVSAPGGGITTKDYHAVARVILYPSLIAPVRAPAPVVSQLPGTQSPSSLATKPTGVLSPSADPNAKDGPTTRVIGLMAARQGVPSSLLGEIQLRQGDTLYNIRTRFAEVPEIDTLAPYLVFVYQGQDIDRASESEILVQDMLPPVPHVSPPTSPRMDESILDVTQADKAATSSRHQRIRLQRAPFITVSVDISPSVDRARGSILDAIARGDAQLAADALAGLDGETARSLAVSYLDCCGRNMLHHAAAKGNVDVLGTLVDYARLGSLTLRGETALHLAAAGGHLECVQYILASPLLSPDAVVALDHSGCTPIHRSLYRRHLDVAQVMFASTVSIKNTVSRYGDSIVSLLWRNGDILWQGVRDDSQSLLRWLLTYARDQAEDGIATSLCPTTDAFGHSLLHYAARLGRTSIASMLLTEFHANPAYTALSDGKTALHVACETGAVDIVNTFLRLCANPASIAGVRDVRGRDALMTAVASRQLEVAEILLSEGIVKKKVLDHHGQSALVIACQNKDLNMVSLLLRYRDLFAEPHAALSVDTTSSDTQATPSPGKRQGVYPRAKPSTPKSPAATSKTSKTSTPSSRRKSPAIKKNKAKSSPAKGKGKTASTPTSPGTPATPKRSPAPRRSTPSPNTSVRPSTASKRERPRAPAAWPANRKSVVTAAIESGSMEILDAVLKSRAFDVLGGLQGLPETRVESRYSPLWTAVTRNQPDMVKVLLDHGASVSVGCSDGRAPVHISCQDDQYLHITKILVMRGADMTSLHPETGRTPMQCAIADRAYETVLALVYACTHPAPMDVQDLAGLTSPALAVLAEADSRIGRVGRPGSDAASAALPETYAKALQRLLTIRDDVNLSLRLQTAVILACHYPSLHTDVFDEVLAARRQCEEEGARMSSQPLLVFTGSELQGSPLSLPAPLLAKARSTPTHALTKEGTPSGLQAVQTHAENILTVLSRLAPAVWARPVEAAFYKHCFSTLLDHEDDYSINAVENFSGFAQICRKGYWGAAESLIKRGCHVNLRDGVGRTGLFYACRHGQSDLADLILSHQGSAGTVDGYGQTPFHLALSNGWHDLASSLIPRVKKGNARLLSSYFLSAAKVGNLSCLELVSTFAEDTDALMDARDQESNTPLIIACQSGHLQCVKWLLSNGAKPFEPNSLGETPLSAALMGSSHRHTLCAMSVIEECPSVLVESPPLVAEFLAKGRYEMTLIHQFALSTILSPALVTAFSTILDLCAELNPNIDLNEMMAAEDIGGMTPWSGAVSIGNYLALDWLKGRGVASQVPDWRLSVDLEPGWFQRSLLLAEDEEENAADGRDATAPKHVGARGLTMTLADTANARCHPLHVAAWNNLTCAAEAMLDLGVDVNVPDVLGRSPLVVAATAGSLNVAQQLIDHGTFKLREAVFVAVENRYEHLALVLWRALQESSRVREEYILSLLCLSAASNLDKFIIEIQRHVSPELVLEKDLAGYTPLHYAVAFGNAHLLPPLLIGVERLPWSLSTTLFQVTSSWPQQFLAYNAILASRVDLHKVDRGRTLMSLPSDWHQGRLLLLDAVHFKIVKSLPHLSRLSPEIASTFLKSIVTTITGEFQDAIQQAVSLQRLLLVEEMDEEEGELYMDTECTIAFDLSAVGGPRDGEPSVNTTMTVSPSVVVTAAGAWRFVEFLESVDPRHPKAGDVLQVSKYICRLSTQRHDARISVTKDGTTVSLIDTLYVDAESGRVQCGSFARAFKFADDPEPGPMDLTAENASLEQIKAATAIQAVGRGHIVRSERERAKAEAATAQTEAAVKIQAVVRGRQTRQRRSNAPPTTSS